MIKSLVTTEPTTQTEPKASISMTISDGKREVVAISEIDLNATLWEDNYYNTLRAVEQALYAAFFKPSGKRPDGTGGQAPGTSESSGST